MTLPSIFNPTIINKLENRIELLNASSKPGWGKMNVSQMLAHLNVMFELGLENKHKRPNAFVRFMLSSFVKNKIVNDVPYKKNSMTAPEMVIKHQPSFEEEKNKVLAYLTQIKDKREIYFNQRKHPSFGMLSSDEWSNLFYKHIDHHLQQFGV